MKRTIVASVLGIAGSLGMAASSNAQSIVFQNYASGAGGVNAPITFASSGNPINANNGITPAGLSVAGHGVGSEFTADLLYSVGATPGTYSSLTAAAAGAGGFNVGGYPAPMGYGSQQDGALAGAGSVSGNPIGYFLGGTVKIAADAGGGPVWFIVEAYNGSSYASSTGAGLWRGQSTPFEIASLATGTALPGNFTTMSGFTVSSVPEPTTMALGGLGLAALMLFRRKQV